jgi:hypothetical protein
MDSRVSYPDLRCLPHPSSGRSPCRILLFRGPRKELKDLFSPVSVARKIFDPLA